MAKYSDNELSKGLKGVSTEDQNDRLDAIIRLFCCLHGRDTYLKAYSKYLAVRLLNKTTLSMEGEEQMIQKLKVECGLNQVNKMVQMIKDLTLSKDVLDGFKKQRSSEAIDGVAF